MNRIEKQVKEFHSTFGLPINETPTIMNLSDQDNFNRISLIQEELSEYAKALAEGDIVKVADALGDLIYVVVGGFVEHGIPVEEVMDEIHRSNMSKIGGYIDEAGKYIKPNNYDKPDFDRILNA